jgi:hypothetical protein
MTTNINSYILGASTVQNTNLHNNVFGNVTGTAVEGDTQLVITTSGDLSGGGTITLGTGGTLDISYTGPVNVSAFTNDSGYITSSAIPTNVSAFTNDSGYITSSAIPTNVSAFTNDSGYITSSAIPTNVSELSNDSGYITSSAIPTNVSSFTNDSGYLTSFTETDPTVPTHVKNITTVNINSWNSANGWGDHAVENYIKDIVSFSTSDLAEGANLYHTDARVDARIPTNVSAFTNDAGYITGYTDTNYYLESASFNTSNGVLTLTKTDTNTVVVDLDGRYQLTGTFAETDTLDSVTSRGNTTSNNITVNDLLVSGDLTVSGTTTTVLSQNTRINENILYLNEGGESTITNAVGNGTTVTFTANNTYSVGYTVDITGVTPSSFNLVDAYVTSTDATTFTVTSNVTDTYVSGGEAYGHAHVNVDLGWGGAYDDGTYAHAGFFRDATDGRFKVFDSYTVEPTASVDIDTSHASFNLAPLQADMFYGDLTGSVTGTVSSIANHSTTNLSEGTNLYYTNARVDARVDARIPTNVSAFTNDAGYITGYTDTNYYLESASFNTSNGVLTLTKTDTNTVVVDLDGRFTDNVHADAMNQGVATTDSPNFVDVTATNFHGTATTAKYADLAEKYTTEIEHPVGTVMMVSASDDYETCPVQTLGYPIGVISEKPAFLMNEECDGQALALKGRVPVRIIGPVKKGEAVFVYENGTAGRQYNGAHIVGVALETNTDTGEKLVECVLKT